MSLRCVSGPHQIANAVISDNRMTEAFDYDILSGQKLPLAASSAVFTSDQISTLPHLATTHYSPNGYTNGACATVGTLPTDFRRLERP